MELTNSPGLSISKKCKYPEEALEFLDYFTQKKTQEYWVKELQQLSVIKGAVNSNTAGPLLMRMAKRIEECTGSIPPLEWILPVPSIGEEAIWMGTVGVLTGKYTAKSWMEWVEKEHKKAVGR